MIGDGFQPLVQRCIASMKRSKALVAVFVSAAGDKVEGFVQVEGVAGEKMPHREFVNSLLVGLVHVLKFMQRAEALDVQTIGHDRVGFSTQQLLGLGGGHFADGGEDRRGVGGGALDRKPRKI